MVAVEPEIKHIEDLRVTLDGMGGSIDAAWYEEFYLGMASAIRALMAFMDDRMTARGRC